MKAPSATRYSYNWLGYVASKGTGAFSSVRANWIEPGINCHNIWAEDGQWQIESTWVGLDGWGDSTVEQTGTSGQCYDGTSSSRVAPVVRDVPGGDGHPFRHGPAR